MRFFSSIALAVLCAAGGVAHAADAPLLMEGKTTLYQRVLTTPSCLLKTTTELKKVPAFSQYYVYADDGQHLQVGASANGQRDGWLSKSCVVPWKQQLALFFTSSAGRDRALIFDEESALDEHIDDVDESYQNYANLLQKVARGERVPHVISQEPENQIDWQSHFYLLPILNSSESMFNDGSYTLKHEIASIVAQEAQSQTQSQHQQLKQSASAQKDQSQQETFQPLHDPQYDSDANNLGQKGDPAIVGFKSAVVFVIDSSISMQPYIDRTRDAVRKIYQSIEAEDLGKSVHFGLISFRGDSRLVKGLEYTTHTYLMPGEATTAEEFDAKVKSLHQARVSSKQFNEDAFAGIGQALNSIDWSQYGGRYIVLITDAGALDPDDPQASTTFDARSLNIEAQYHGAAIYTLHLCTPSGKRAHNHESAAQQYRKLSYNPVLGKPLYYPVDGGSVKNFGAVVDQLNQSLTEQVRSVSLGQAAAGSALSSRNITITNMPKETNAKNQLHPVRGQVISANDATVRQVKEDSDTLGYAMRLAWLGRVQGTQSPEFLRGWLSDRDIRNHNRIVCTPIVLVNRNQLSDLYTLVRGVIDSGISGIISSDAMFDQLQGLAAQMGRDPSQLNKAKTLGEMGIMGELLDDLPYKSRIAGMSPDDWFNLGAQEQENIIRDLEGILAYINVCSSDNDRWIKLNEDADETEAVYPMPLDSMP